MNLDIFEKALYYYDSGLVYKKQEKSTRNKTYFDVDGDEVVFSYGKGYLEITCECKHCSIKSIYNALCSKKIACIYYRKAEAFKKLQKKRKK